MGEKRAVSIYVYTFETLCIHICSARVRPRGGRAPSTPRRTAGVVHFNALPNGRRTGQPAKGGPHKRPYLPNYAGTGWHPACVPNCHKSGDLNLRLVGPVWGVGETLAKF